MALLLVAAALLAVTVCGIKRYPEITSAAGTSAAALVALLTGLVLLFEFRRGFRYLLRRKLRERVLGYLGGTYDILREALEAARHGNRTLLVNGTLFINDAWPSSSGITWSQISESDPEIEVSLLEDYSQAKRLMETLPTSKQIYWRHLYSAWETLSYEISREALGKGYVTDRWLDAAEDWCICLIALHEDLRQHPLGQGPSDAPVVAPLERLRALSADDALFKEAGPDDLVYIHTDQPFDGPYLLSSDLRQVGALPTLETQHSPAMERMVPMFEVDLEDSDGDVKTVGLIGSKYSVFPAPSSGEVALARFDISRWQSGGTIHAFDLEEKS